MRGERSEAGLPEPDLELLRRFRDGDEDAARALEGALGPPLERFCHGYVRDAEEARDVVQEVWAKLFASETEPDHPRLWIYRVARNACLNRIRTRERRGQHVPLPTAAPFSASLTGHLTRLLAEEDRARLTEALGRLSEAQREVLELRYGEGLARAEVALLLGLEESVVKSRIYEGLKRLRAEAERGFGRPRA